MPMQPQQTAASNTITKQSRWLNWLIVSLTLLVWVILIGILLWVLGQVARSLILLAIGALLAYALYPLVKTLQRVVPRPIAIVIVYLIFLGAVTFLLYTFIVAIVHQLTSLTQYVQSLIHSPGNSQLQPIFNLLQQFGVTPNQLTAAGQQLVAQLQGILRNVVPFISNTLNIMLNIILIALLSIYFLVSGPKTTRWLRTKTPITHRSRIDTLLNTVGGVIGGYIRGNLLLATVISALTGIGLAIIGVPYPFLLATIAFVMEFIPVIGIYITGLAILLLAITQGWIIVIFALGLMLLLQLLENNYLAPRILGGSIGLNPIVTIFALIAGNDLFGIAGAFFAAPIAGLIQTLVQAFWIQWRDNHPELFPPDTPDENKPIRDTEVTQNTTHAN
jgi:predicted PurR-regulated permease PerM